MSTLLPRSPLLTTVVLPLALALVFSGCTLLGLGAAAGAVVGGCALADRDQDNNVTQEELSAAIYDRWDANGDGALTRAEFDAGAASRPAFSNVSGSFDDWDANDDGTLTRAEFSAGVASSGGTAGWVDARCDELGL